MHANEHDEYKSPSIGQSGSEERVTRYRTNSIIPLFKKKK